MACVASPDGLAPAEVLLLETEPLAAAQMTQALRGAGYWIVAAASFEQALARLSAPGAAFKVLVADLTEAPPSSARRLLRIARRRFPEIRIVCPCDRPRSDRPRGWLRTCGYDAAALRAAILDGAQGGAEDQTRLTAATSM